MNRRASQLSLMPLAMLTLGMLATISGRSQQLSAAEAPRPNVLFCIADDASCHYGEAYHCSWVKTPHIDALAKKGLIFDNVYTPTAKCAPSRAAILTGRFPWQLEDAANHQAIFPTKFKVMTEALTEAGIHCGSAGKTWGPGDAKTADGQQRHFGMTPMPGGAKKEPGDVLPGGFRDFLAARKPDQPVLFWFGSHDPYRAYTLDSGLEAGKKATDVDRVPTYWPDNDTVRRDMLDYAVAVEAFDREVGSLLKVLDERGLADSTLVVVTSDHGMPFPRSKGHNYEISNHVPMVIYWPGHHAKPGQRVADFVSFVDLAPTLLELFAVDGAKQGMSPITGVSFTDLLRGKSEHERRFIITGRERNDSYARPGTEAGLGYPVRAIRVGELLYIHNYADDRWPCGNPELGLKDTDPGPTKSLIEQRGQADPYWQFCFGKRPGDELYDVVRDADCVKNLAEDAAYYDRLSKMRETLYNQLKSQNDPRVLGEGDIFDRYPTAKPPEKAAAVKDADAPLPAKKKKKADGASSGAPSSTPPTANATPPKP